MDLTSQISRLDLENVQIRMVLKDNGRQCSQTSVRANIFDLDQFITLVPDCRQGCVARLVQLHDIQEL